MKQNIKFFPNHDELSQAAAEYLIELARKAIQDHGIFSVALSGGSTPAPVYRALGSIENRDRLEWERIHLFWGDERCVPPDHPNSNYRMVKEQLLQSVSIPEENIHRVPGEMEVRMAAFTYEEVLRNFFVGEWPRFDLVLLGMGEDGHTASLFPNSAGLNEEQRWFIANYAPERDSWRLSLTKNAINAARHIIVMVAGQTKADMLYDVFEGEHAPYLKPIQFVEPVDGEMVWLVDHAAAGKLIKKYLS
jgi:6-phosphogluconolactonase